MGIHRPLQFTYGLGCVLRRLGQDTDPRGRERTFLWSAKYVQLLIEQQGFPAPFPVMVGAKLNTGVTAKSRWSQASVDAWLEQRDPPGGASAGEETARREAANDMDANAAAVAAGMHKSTGLRLVAAS